MHTLYYSITIKQWYLLDHFAALSIKSVTKIVKQSLENMTFLSIRFENFLKFDKRGSKYGPSGENFFWKLISVPFVFGTLEWSATDFRFTQNSCFHFIFWYHDEYLITLFSYFTPHRQNLALQWHENFWKV